MRFYVVLCLHRDGQGYKKNTDKILSFRGAWVAQLVKHLPSAQVMILEFWD